MGYVVLHLDKSPGNESAMTDHIERNVIHSNVDPSRVHLNKELVKFPYGVYDRTEAIQHSLDNAGLTRKVGKNQVKVIRFMLSGSSEDMERIEKEGKLDDWCRDNIEWLETTYGKDNVVAATLHMDETTPHIHASIVPVVHGERRKKSTTKKQIEQTKTKRKYKTKDPNRARLCADDVMAKAKLTEYQDSYAEAMSKYGLQRGVKGSDARHITLTEFYRNQVVESQNLQTNIELLLAETENKRNTIELLKEEEQGAKLKTKQADELREQKEAELKKTESELSQAKGQLKTAELKNKVVDVSSNIMDGIGSMIGTSKIKLQEQEIETLKEEKKALKREVKTLKQDMQSMEQQHQSVVDKLKQELKKIYSLFPQVKDLLFIERTLQVLNFSEELIRRTLNMKPVGFKGKLYSPEYKRSFETEGSVAEVKKHPVEKGRLELLIDGLSPTRWFREKNGKFLENIGVKVKKKSKRMGM